MLDVIFFLETLGRLNCGAILLDEMGKIISSNRIAQEILLEDDDGISINDALLRVKLKEMLRLSGSRFKSDAETWMVVDRGDRRPVVLHALPAGGKSDPYSRSLVIAVDFESVPYPAPATLKRLFALTTAESRLAASIARGDSPAEIALSNGVSLATVRTQLASIFVKTGTRRQADLVALLARAVILP